MGEAEAKEKMRRPSLPRNARASRSRARPLSTHRRRPQRASDRRAVHRLRGCLLSGTVWHRALFLPLGAQAIYLANIGRVASMVLFQTYWTAAFDFMHGLGTTALFALWATRAASYPPRGRGTVVALLQHRPASAQKTPIRNPARQRRFPLVPFGRRTARRRTASLTEDISPLPLYSRKPPPEPWPTTERLSRSPTRTSRTKCSTATSRCS
ncbi:MAG: hypothetical protein BRD48_01505 [Bacteroidetes bacterium QS_9_68_14]|nr:MAG: hypothetical protein BRD48_01505 [Bacteroidetes bacterium QS_9_68_14]